MTRIEFDKLREGDIIARAEEQYEVMGIDRRNGMIHIAEGTDAGGYYPQSVFTLVRHLNIFQRLVRSMRKVA